MKVIYKYPLATTDYQAVPMPTGAKILCAQVQGEHICLWALVDDDPQAARLLHHIYIIGTGNELPDIGLVHIGTVQMPPFVWHVFEEAGKD